MPSGVYDILCARLVIRYHARPNITSDGKTVSANPALAIAFSASALVAK
jgi:hypothetical protein